MLAGTPFYARQESLARRRGGDDNLDRLLAVGLGKSQADPGASNDEYRLLIFGQRLKLRDHPIVERAIKEAKGEARFVYTGPIGRHSFWQPARRRPLAPGVSIGHRRVTAGTLGCFVDMGDRGGICILSNNHVLAFSDRGRPGDPIVQPGKLDGGRDPGDVVGHLHVVIPILRGVSASNLVDCAVAVIANGQPYNLTPCVNGTENASPKLIGVAEDLARPEDEVIKCGRTTGVTRGRIDAIEIDKLEINFGSQQRPDLARFDGQISCYSEGSNFSKPGDSGSIVMTPSGRAVGLLFAGSQTGAPTGGGGLTFCNPIQTVLNELGAELVV